MTVLITLTTAGANTGPFNLYSDLDGYVTPFASAIAKSSLLAGYTSTVVPNGTAIIKVLSAGDCTTPLYIDLYVPATTTTSTTLAPTSCRTYAVTMDGPPDQAYNFIYYTDCLGNPFQFMQVDNFTTIYICALEGSLSVPLFAQEWITWVDDGPCP